MQPLAQPFPVALGSSPLIPVLQPCLSPSHFKDHPFTISQAPHTGFFLTFSCRHPYLECFFKSVIQVLRSSPKRSLTVPFGQIHEHPLSTQPEVSQMTRDSQSPTSKILELTDESDTSKESMVSVADS